MSEYCKVRVLLNTKTPRLSRVVDAETDKDIPVSDVHIDFGYSTKYQLKVQFTMEDPFVEIVTDTPGDSPGVSELAEKL